MRSGLSVVWVLASVLGCAPKPAPQTPLDEEFAQRAQKADLETPAALAPRPVAPPGKGLRTGTIPRDRLVAVLDAGPGMFLRQFEITPQLSGDRFVGWQLVQLLDRTGPLVDVDVVPGDVLLAINGKPLSRPDQLQTVWDSLRTANQVTAQMWRGQTQFELQFAIEPQVAAPAAAPAAAPKN